MKRKVKTTIYNDELFLKVDNNDVGYSNSVEFGGLGTGTVSFWFTKQADPQDIKENKKTIKELRKFAQDLTNALNDYEGVQ